MKWIGAGIFFEIGINGALLVLFLTTSIVKIVTATVRVFITVLKLVLHPMVRRAIRKVVRKVIRIVDERITQILTIVVLGEAIVFFLAIALVFLGASGLILWLVVILISAGTIFYTLFLLEKFSKEIVQKKRMLEEIHKGISRGKA